MIDTIEFLHGTPDCLLDELALLIGSFGCEFISERYESGDFALWGIEKNLCIYNFWWVFALEQLQQQFELVDTIDGRGHHRCCAQLVR